jgi:hypothetical protein
MKAAVCYEFARVLDRKAASILQMALGRVGGIPEAKKIAGMAEAHYAQIAPHLYCGPIISFHPHDPGSVLNSTRRLLRRIPTPGNDFISRCWTNQFHKVTRPSVLRLEGEGYHPVEV